MWARILANSVLTPVASSCKFNGTKSWLSERRGNAESYIQEVLTTAPLPALPVPNTKQKINVHGPFFILLKTVKQITDKIYENRTQGPFFILWWGKMKPSLWWRGILWLYQNSPLNVMMFKYPYNESYGYRGEVTGKRT